MKEKAKYLEAARRQVDRSEAVKKDNAKVTRDQAREKTEYFVSIHSIFL